jgi:hypothetical protein
MVSSVTSGWLMSGGMWPQGSGSSSQRTVKRQVQAPSSGGHGSSSSSKWHGFSLVVTIMQGVSVYLVP